MKMEKSSFIRQKILEIISMLNRKFAYQKNHFSKRILYILTCRQSEKI